MRAIVFVLRGCPAGWLGGYGNEWVGTPHLDRLAAEGVVFDRHISDCPDPAAAGRAWFSGRHQTPEPNPPAPFPGKEGAAGSGEPPRSRGGLGDSGEESYLLPHLRAAGVHTVVVRANHPDTDAPASFYAGWGEVFDARPEADDDSPLDALARAFPSLLDRLAEVPRWLVWVETDRLLPPWDVPQDVFEAYTEDEEEEDKYADRAAEQPEEDESEGDDDATSDSEAEPDAEAEPGAVDAVEVEAVIQPPDPPEPVTPFFDPPTGPFDPTDLAAWEWLHRSFAAVVTALDAELGRLFDHLRGRGLDRTAAWVVTSDFGYPFGEHGQIGPYRPWLHEELVHLPLLVRLPAGAEGGRRVPAFTQPADLAPTLLELLAAAAVPDTIAGRSLLPLARGEVETVRPFACSGLELNGTAEWSVRTREWALLLPAAQPDGDPPRAPRLYEKPDDRWEVNDLARQRPEVVEELEKLIRGD